MLIWNPADETPADAARASMVVASPTGLLTLVEAAGAIVELRWRGARPIAASTPLLAEAGRQLDAYFAGRLGDFDLPVLPAGSPFQHAVWLAMCRIPCGSTRSYGAIGGELDTPARAVGGACGTNPIPILIPCHRILASGGSLGGYSGQGGAGTKRFLLELEGAGAADADPRQMQLL